MAALAGPSESGSSEALLRAITARMPAMLLLLDPAGRIVWINRTNPGVTLAATLGRSLFEYAEPADQPDIRATLERVLATRQPDRFAGHGPGARGPRSRWEAWVAPVELDGRAIGLTVITRDVSEEWEVYEALRDREQRLSLVLDAAGMGTWRFDLPSRTVDLDDRARAIYGIAEARLDSLTFTRSRIHPDDQAAADEAAFTSMRTRSPYAAESRIVRPDGAVRWVSITGSPVVDASGAVVALMGTVTDVTARHEYDARALQTQRLEAVGQLTAGIAHNFNNVLATIVPTLRLLEREAPADARTLVQGAAQAASRAADLVQQLMTFAGRSRAPVRTTEPPGGLVERTLQLCRSTFGRAISLDIDIEAGLPAVHVDGGQIEQLLLNILLNARDAVEFVERPKVAVRVASESAHRAAVVITIDDNGAGVAEEVRPRMFDPFFTTKEVGRGTGLGLSTAYAIAREHGGSLRHEPAPGGGARFIVEIPAAGAAAWVAPAAVSAQVPGPAPVAGARAAVLVVDDDDGVRHAVQAVLESEGYHVATASSGQHAIVALAGASPVDVVLLDLNMPGVSWRAVVEATRQHHPEARIIVYTGGVAHPDASVDAWLSKPTGPDALLDAIARVLASPRP